MRAIDDAAYRQARLESSDLGGDLGDGFFDSCHRGDVRRHCNAPMMPESVRRRQRLFLKDVEGGTTDRARIDQCEQILVDQQRAA